MRHFTLPVALCAAAFTLPAAADTVTSFARAYAGGQLCATGPSPNCVTSEVFRDLRPPVEVTVANGAGAFRAEQISDYFDINAQGLPTGNLQNWAQADLNQGNLRLTGMAFVNPRPAGSDASIANPYVYGFASAWLGDTFTVLNQNGGAYTGATASNLSIQLDGVLGGTPDTNLGFTASITLARPGYLAAMAAHDYDAAGGLIVDTAYTPWLTAGDLLPPSLNLTVAPTQSSFEWMVTAFMTYNFRQTDDGFSYVLADLGHTITVQMQTPEGTVFSSGSGLFPGSVPAAPVPEPAGWALLLAGGAGVLALARRRHGI